MFPHLEVKTAGVDITREHALRPWRLIIFPLHIIAYHPHKAYIVCKFLIPIESLESIPILISKQLFPFLMFMFRFCILVELRMQDVLAVIHHGFEQGGELHLGSLFLEGYELLPVVQSTVFH